MADSFWENTDCQHSSQESQFSHEWLTFYPIQSLQASGFWSFRLRWIEWFILSTCLDWGGLNDSSSPLAKLSTWHPCHFFGNLVSLNLHIIESGDYGVERLSRDKLATLLKWCILFHLIPTDALRWDNGGSIPAAGYEEWPERPTSPWLKYGGGTMTTWPETPAARHWGCSRGETIYKCHIAFACAAHGTGRRGDIQRVAVVGGWVGRSHMDLIANSPLQIKTRSVSICSF